MDLGQPIKTVILGAGAGGTALIDLFIRSPGVEVIGIADKDPNAPGLKRASEFNIPTTNDVISLITRNGTGLIVDVTGDPAMQTLIANHKPPTVDVLQGTAAKVFLTLVQHETQIQAQLLQTEKLATIGTLSSGIAHDINNRLYLIMSLAENMLDDLDPAEVKDHAGQILRAVRRIRTIVQGITGYARVSLPDHLENIRLDSIVNEALKISQYATIFHNVSVKKEYAGNPVLRANPQEILQVFVNLIINATQAMEGKGTLTLSVYSKNKSATAIISDTGPGIPKDLLDKIFEPFFTTKVPGKGTGLGLYMVQMIVKKYGGRISVKNQKGGGATFLLEFPEITQV